MREIKGVNSLPKSLRILSKQVQGVQATLFYECESDIELLNLAKDGKCEETTIIMDKDTDRGYMTAFSFNESQLTDLTGNKMVQMKLYFTELNKKKTKEYRIMLSQHRRQQEDQMINRRTKSGIIGTGGAND